MNAYASLMDHISSLRIIDTHEHLPFESDRVRDADLLAEWLMIYFRSDLLSAGLPERDLATVLDIRQDLKMRWELVEPYWRAAEDTGYGKCLSLAARDLYGVERIGADSIELLDRRFKDARNRGGHYRFVLKEKSNIALAIHDDWMHIQNQDTHDPFVFTIRVDAFICPTQYRVMRGMAAEVGMEVHTLSDWMEVTRRHIDRQYNAPGSKIVCLKCGLAYHRNLRFDKIAYADAERCFNEMYADSHLPDWRSGVSAAKPLGDWMMHFVCGIADERKLVFQVHTGIQEGNGNFISDANPTLLTNLFLEYRHVRFDVFHMGYPYVMELGTLAKNFQNVFIDMCWGHVVSPEAARRALVEWLDAVPANKISAFGGDYCFIDGVYGHQLLARQNVAAALTRKVTDGSMSRSRAEEVASWLFFENPRRLFGLDRFLSEQPVKSGTGACA